MKELPKGIIPAMVTPFDRRGEIDVNGVGRVVNYLLDGGVHGIFVSGSQGEFWALTEAEKGLLFERTVEAVDGRVPVYGGTGAESTGEVIRISKAAEDVGVDAVSVLTPYYIRPGMEELFDHYQKIAGRVDLPILVYSNPGRTGVTIDPSTMGRLHEECSNIVGIKDSSGDLTLTSEYIDRCGDDFSVLAGRDTLILATLLYGGKGAIAACGNIVPELIVRIYDGYMLDDLQIALEAQRKLAPLRHAFSFGTFPVVIKEAMNLMGFSVGRCRDPVSESSISKENMEKLRRILTSLGVEIKT